MESQRKKNGDITNNYYNQVAERMRAIMRKKGISQADKIIVVLARLLYPKYCKVLEQFH